MKKIFIFAITVLIAISADAQTNRQRKFSPEKFRAELEHFIIKEACLTPAESAAFFPVYNEMYKKQRVVFDSMRRLDKTTPATEEDCRKAVKERDKLDLELKKIQQTYHNKFLGILSGKKVFNVLKAEDRFHHRMLKRGDENWNKKK